MLRFLTAGESHGKGMVTIVEGMVAGLPLDEEYLVRDLRRRQGGYGRGGRMQIEQDRAEILSGVRHGLTLGTPIALLILNQDWVNWKEIMSVVPPTQEIEPVTRLRPGHADLAGVLKYGFQDVRPIIERASARDTAPRVAAGAVAKRLLEEMGIAVHSHVVAIGKVQAREGKHIDWERVEASPVRCADADASQQMVKAIDQAREAGDTLGGLFEVIASGVPVGLGSHVHWDRRLDGRLAQAVMSINAVKGVEIGEGFAIASAAGSQAHDIIEPGPGPGGRPWSRTTNRAGGTEGGISNGQPIVVRGAVKPIPTLGKPLPSVDLRSGQAVQAHYERSDVCIVPAAGVVGEAMVAIVLAGTFLEKFGGDSLEETRHNYQGFQDSLATPPAR